MAQEDIPILFSDAHADVAELHVASGVVNRAAGLIAEVVDEKLLFLLESIGTTMIPEATQGWVFLDPGQEVVDESDDTFVSAESREQGSRVHGDESSPALAANVFPGRVLRQDLDHRHTALRQDPLWLSRVVHEGDGVERLTSKTEVVGDADV